MILPIQTDSADLETVGGKGRNLVALAEAGFLVPPGFLITTQAYQRFLEANDLAGRIFKRAAEVRSKDPEALRSASAEIRSWFSAGSMPEELAVLILQAYRGLGSPPVAVRSSATAEDLLDMSFAGQQDTYLNVLGEESLLRAVVDCWSSLWTARAIGYRARNNIAQENVALAVVVQEMVPAEASGVLFTANPLTGLRTELVIDATLGLGEALVSGQVEPDHYVVDGQQGVIRQKSLGKKSVAAIGDTAGGVRLQEIEAADRQALPDEQILALASLGQEIEAAFNFPQDIEWAWAGGRLYILQARPITSLFPIPDGMGPDPLKVLFSFASVQGIVDPITPLGMDAIRQLFAGGASLFDYQLTHETQGVVASAGERLWVNFTPVLRLSLGRRIAGTAFGGVDPGLVPVLEALRAEPQLAQSSNRIRMGTIRRILIFFGSMLPRILHDLRFPEGRAAEIQRAAQTEIESFQAGWANGDGGTLTLSDRLAAFREIYNAFPYAIPNLMTGLVAGLVPLALLVQLSRRLTGSGDLALTVTRGLTHNVTTEMDLALWEIASAIRRDSEAYRHVEGRSAEVLAQEYLAGSLPVGAQKAFDVFLDRYGMRGIGEIDIGRPRWREYPVHIMQVTKGYLKIEARDRAPDIVFRRGAEEAAAAVEKLAEAARDTFGGRLKARVIQGAARRVRALAGLRESPKFHIIQMMGIIRQGLLESGRDLVSAGVLNQADDLFYYYLNELDLLARGEKQDWKALAARRRASYARELRRKRVPRLLLSDGRAFYEGLLTPEGEEGLLIGSPVSPGVVSGPVRVVLDPHQAQLEPGEIMVCPGTDPAWTPLFLSAGGLIMEIGGVMTHGAIVAREYGIPAVVGVDQATTHLQTGQWIQLDGSTGRILVEDQAGSG